jgi:hypothetical protein
LELTAIGSVLAIFFCTLHSADWPDFLLLSYVNYIAFLANHIKIHMNQNDTLKMEAVDSFEKWGKTHLLPNAGTPKRHRLIHNRCESLKTYVIRHTEIVRKLGAGVLKDSCGCSRWNIVEWD